MCSQRWRSSTRSRQRAHEEGAADARAPRDRTRRVLRLASGEILVAGGFDGTGTPVTTLEWFDAGRDAGRTRRRRCSRGTRVRSSRSRRAARSPCVRRRRRRRRLPERVGHRRDRGARGGDAHPGAADEPRALRRRAGRARALDGRPVAAVAAVTRGLRRARRARRRAGEWSATRPAPDPGLAMWLDTTQMQLDAAALRHAQCVLVAPRYPLLVTGPEETSPDRLAAVSWDIDTGLTLQPGSPGVSGLRDGPHVRRRRHRGDREPGARGRGAARHDGRRDGLSGSDVQPPVTVGGGSTLLVHRRGSQVDVRHRRQRDGQLRGPRERRRARVVGVRAGGTTPAVVMNMIVSRVGTP